MSGKEFENSPDIDGVARALSQVTLQGDTFLHGDTEARQKLIASAKELVAAAETPVEALLWHTWALVLIS